MHIERRNLNVLQVLNKITTKDECSIDHHLQRSIFKGLWFTLIRGSPHSFNSKMNQVATQIIFKIIVFKSSVL